MKTPAWLLLSAALCGSLTLSPAQEKLIYHDIRTGPGGSIIPWYNDDPGVSFDHVVNLVWNFWDTMRVDVNGLPYYMNHQVWKPVYNDPRGIGGDQIQMALSSWRLLYAYAGNERVKQNMKFMADYYLTHSLSPSTCRWPDLPFPYNTFIYSGLYDGDMVIGKGFLQPDKAGSLGLELVHLYKMSSRDFFVQTSSRNYLEAAKAIARTLAATMKPGDAQRSPWPFKVNAFTGEVGKLISDDEIPKVLGESGYTSNWCPTMELFLELESLDPEHRDSFHHAFTSLLQWMKAFPIANNRWGPFFEDVKGWSDTQINAVTCARFMLTHREYFPDWKREVDGIFSWVYTTLGNENWTKYGVTVVNEQTVYHTPGESHTAREGETELLYCLLSGDEARAANALRQLIWATYMVDVDGTNRFPSDEPWLTDGYGDYVRHYLRAMDDDSELAPAGQDHILSSTSIIQQADYQGQTNKFLVPYVKGDDAGKVRLYYRTYDQAGTERIRLSRKPARILLGDRALQEAALPSSPGYSWQQLRQGGLLTVTREKGNEVTIID